MSLSDIVYNIRHAVYAKKVREAIASAIEEISNKEDKNLEIYNNMVIGAGESNAEIVDARLDNNTGVRYEKVGKRLDKISSQMDEKANLLSARMDTFTKLEESSTTGDAELTDGRVGADGTVYENIGNNIRTNGNNIMEIKKTLGSKEEKIQEYTTNITQYVKALYVTINITSGIKYYFKINSYTGQYLKNINAFLYREDGTYKALYNFTKVQNYQVGDEQFFEVDENFEKIRFNINLTDDAIINEETIDISFGYVIENTGIIQKLENLQIDIENIKNNIGNSGINVLIFGDSYSAQKRWINSLSNFITIDNIINLGVSGARLRDSYTDRETYPYSDRPILGGTGNNNILASQIEKLKRLMTGTDLDSGETQIYENTTPDIILIELGKNDYSDNDTKYENYLYEIFEKIEDNYVKTSATSTPTVRNFYKPKDVENLDRTCFVGALAYAYSELHKIFPKALILFISNSNLWNLTTEPDRDYRKHYQIKKACELMSIPLIDWYAEGLTPNFLAYWEGEGTESNPYLSYLPSELTLDELHPNDKGAELLGLKTATYIEQYLKFIKKMKYQ